MKKFFSGLIFCICITFVSQAQNTIWATSPGFTKKVKVINNALYACGNFFVAKYSLTGTLIWMTPFSGPGLANDVTVVNGKVYVTGYFFNTVNFNPQSNNSLTSSGNNDVFIGVYNEADGSYIHATRLGGATRDIGNSIEADTDGNIYLGGEMSSSVNFDINGGNNTVTTTDGLNVKGFLVKYAASSPNVYSLVWLNTYIGTVPNQTHTSNVLSSEISASTGVIYITGYFSGSNTSFNSTVGDYLLSPTMNSIENNWNAFVASYDINTGKCKFAKQISSPESSVSRDICLYNGDLYITGDVFAYNVPQVNFDLNGGSNLRSTTGARNDIFVAKYNATSCVLGFADLIGCGSTAPPPPNGPLQSNVAGNGICANSTGVYITGGFWGTTDFDPGTGTANLIGTGSYRDIFIAKYSLTGAYNGAFKVGGTNDDAGYSIGVAGSGDVTASGYIGTNNTDFDPGPGTILLSGSGFLAGYSSATVLPVNIESFSGQVSGEKVLMHWKTNAEMNNKGFIVQRLIGNDWMNIGLVPADKKREYSFTDIPKQSGSLYYRLEQTDADGKRTLSSVLKIVKEKSTSIRIYPNPTPDFVIIEYSTEKETDIVTEIFTPEGKRVFVAAEKRTAGFHQQYVNMQLLQKGIYIYRIKAGAMIAEGKILKE